MKTSRLTTMILMSVTGAALFASVAQAEPRAARKAKSHSVLDQNPEERYVLVTGSNIPQKVQLRSIGTTTPYNVRIYSHRELQSTGRSNVGEALSALEPSLTLSGR
ncbi:MAG: hypothetical protein ABIR71_14500 [Chthoniobacterales bacterium]